MRRLILGAAALLLTVAASPNPPAPVFNLNNSTVTATGGNTARTTSSRASDTLTAADFGAAGNGVTDDTTALQSLFNAGKHVFLQPGTYAVTCLTVPTGLRLSGAGPSAAILKQTSSACPVLQGTGVTDVSISDLQIQGSSQATYGIYATNNGGTAPARWRIRNVNVNGVSGATSDCIHIHTGADIVITGNSVSGCGQHGIVFDGTASRFQVSDNNISSVSGAGIIFMIGTDGAIVGNTINVAGPNGDCITGYDAGNLRVQVSSNTCLGSTNNGIHVGGSSLTVTGNNVYNASLTGIFVAAVTFPGGVKTFGAASNNVTVTGNTVKNITTANQNGLTLLTCFECTVTGNTVTGATQNGIMIELSNNNTITGNHVGSTTGNGIDIRGSAYNVIAGNEVASSSADAYRSEQDTTNITGAGTVNPTNNVFVGNYAQGNNRDYVEGTGAADDYYQSNFADGATGGTSPYWILNATSIWQGAESQGTNQQISTVSGKQVQVKDIANVANFITLAGAASGSSPVIGVNGGDSVRNLNIAAKGSSGAVVMVSHLGSSASAPTISACGTTPSVSGTDTKGTVTVGTGTVTACTITFNAAYSSTPACVASTNNSSTTAAVTSASTSAITVGFSATLGGGSFNYICMQ